MHQGLRTPLCDLLGIDVPIVQAGMGYVARGELCAAVSQAGALGVIGAASLSAKRLREEIQLVRDRTDRPFGVDVLFATIGRPAADDETVRFTREVSELLDVVFEERVPVLISGLGDPGPVVPQAPARRPAGLLRFSPVRFPHGLAGVLRFRLPGTVLPGG